MSSYDDCESALDSNIKLEQSPTGNFGFSFSRASSVGSVNAISCSSASSTHNTDDEDSDVAAMQSNSFKERRREAHTHAEQKRRDAIKKGYEELQSVVPTCTESSSSQKLSKATILQKSIDYIQYLRQQKKKHEDELENLKKEAMALGIMKSNYEQLVRNCQNVDPQGSDQVSDEEKFYVFQQLVDNLFQTFNTSVAVSSFEELSQCVTTWLEDNCKPNMLRELMMNILSGSNISSSN